VKLKKTLKPSRPGKKTQKNPKNHWAGFFFKKTRVFSNPAYDEESDEWRPLCPMPTPRTTFGCCAVPLAALEPLLAGAGEVRAARLLVKGHAAEVQQTAVRAQAVVQVQVLQASQLADGHAHLVCANLEENQLCVRRLRGEELSQGIQQQLENSIS
jgi:hypothetical protein